jgi:ankyrin repeat protein
VKARGKTARARTKAALGAILVALAALAGTPASAQFSKSYKFLLAVREKDGQAVTDELNQPGSTMVNTRDSTNGETALHIVTARRDLGWMSFLLAKGADPNIADGRGTTPMMLAANLGFTEGLSLLLAQGARVDETGVTGETPLIIAVHRRDIGMMRVLLKAGANPDRADSSGRTARDYAALDGAENPLLAEITAGAKPRRAGPTYGPKF